MEDTLGETDIKQGGAKSNDSIHRILSPNDLVERLKQKGVTFELCSEKDASDYLARSNNYLRAASYRKLYPKKVGGSHDGEYIGLDFEALRRLSSADRVLRCALREICIDVEHFARVRLLERARAEGEDGWSIVTEYLEGLPKRGERVTVTLSRRGVLGDYHDEYSGDLIAHYEQQGYPLWVFLEVVEFGRFCDFWLFCAKRWNDKRMFDYHYVLKSVKALRNASCHNSCIINGLSTDSDRAGFPISDPILVSLREHGLKNSKSTRAKLRNLRVAQIAAALFASNEFCQNVKTGKRHAEEMFSVRMSFKVARPICPADGSLVSFFDFILRLVDIWVPKS